MDIPARGNILGGIIPARYMLAVLGSIGMAIVYGLKVNLSVAMVGMLNHTAIGMASEHEDAVESQTECQATNSTWRVDGYESLTKLYADGHEDSNRIRSNNECHQNDHYNDDLREIKKVLKEMDRQQSRLLDENETLHEDMRKMMTKIQDLEGMVRKLSHQSTTSSFCRPPPPPPPPPPPLPPPLTPNAPLRIVKGSHTLPRVKSAPARPTLSITPQDIANVKLKKAAEVDGPFEWSSAVQGIILSCYFWGYFVSQIPGARVAELFSAKWVMFFSVTINVVCTLLTPVCAAGHYIAVVIMRVGEGIGGGVTFPAMHVLLSKWAPPSERSVMAALVYAGTSLGTVISMLMAGALTATLGWQSVFYVMGGLSCIWCVLWVALVADSPQQQSLISAEERAMIVNALGGNDDGRCKKHPPVPWRSVMTSPAFLAILVAHVCSNWGWYMLLIELPFYMKQVLNFNMTENTVSTALPFLSLWLFSMALSRALDALRSRGVITTTCARKIATLFASAVPAACLFALCFVGCARAVAVALTALAVTGIGGMFCGFLSNHIDIAPNYAGTLMAITNTVATVPGIVVPIFVGYLTHGNQTISAWRIIFFVTIGLYIIEILVYTIFGSGEQQPWNDTKPDDGETFDAVEAKPLNTEK